MEGFDKSSPEVLFSCSFKTQHEIKIEPVFYNTFMDHGHSVQDTIAFKGIVHSKI